MEQQYIRSITNDLKDALIDYAYSMSAAARKAEDSSSSFIQYMTAVENDMVAGSIENDFVRFSPNKYSKLLKRKESKYQLPNLLDGGIVGSGVQQLKVKITTCQHPSHHVRNVRKCRRAYTRTEPKSYNLHKGTIIINNSINKCTNRPSYARSPNQIETLQ